VGFYGGGFPGLLATVSDDITAVPSAFLLAQMSQAPLSQLGHFCCITCSPKCWGLTECEQTGERSETGVT
jgi:hypothetical protein